MTSVPLTLKFRVSDRHYKEYSFVCSKNLAPSDVSISRETVVKSKLFNQDIFNYDATNNSCTICHSSVRSMPVIPAVLVLEGRRTYGNWKKGRKKLYQCVPDDRRMPIFLVPYEIKNKFNTDSEVYGVPKLTAGSLKVEATTFKPINEKLLLC